LIQFPNGRKRRVLHSTSGGSDKGNL